ncbi:hypothetical protein A2U01_0016000, partial [Trifolium medium]|nr:hypothetical protein [Trifolium medium]
HLKFAHPHQTSRGKQNCSQDYPMPPKFQDKIVQAKKNQVSGSATDPPSPRFSCPVLWWVGKSGGGESDGGVIRQKSAAAAAQVVVAVKLSKWSTRMCQQQGAGKP